MSGEWCFGSVTGSFSSKLPLISMILIGTGSKSMPMVVPMRQFILHWNILFVNVFVYTSTQASCTGCSSVKQPVAVFQLVNKLLEVMYQLSGPMRLWPALTARPQHSPPQGACTSRCELLRQSGINTPHHKGPPRARVFFAGSASSVSCMRRT